MLGKSLTLYNLENATRRKMNLLVCFCCKRDCSSILVGSELSANSTSVSNVASHKVKTLPAESDFDLQYQMFKFKTSEPCMPVLS